MGWEPVTTCSECGEPFDVYTAPEDRICADCLEARAAVLEDQDEEKSEEELDWEAREYAAEMKMDIEREYRDV